MDTFQQSLQDLPTLEEIGRTRFAEMFGGATRGVPLGTLAVYLTELAVEATAAFTAASAGPVEFFLTGQTEAQRDARQAEITEQAPQLAAAGIELVYWGSDVRTGRTHLRVLNLTDSTRELLQSKFGPWVDVESISSRPRIARAAGPAFGPRPRRRS